MRPHAGALAVAVLALAVSPPRGTAAADYQPTPANLEARRWCITHSPSMSVL